MLGVLSVLDNTLPSQLNDISAEACNFLALINVVGTVMRLFVGLEDWNAAALNSSVAFLVQTVVFAVLPGTLLKHGHGDYGTAYIALLFCAKVAYGSSFTLINFMSAEVFGTTNRGQVYGLLIFGLVAASLVAPSLITALYYPTLILLWRRCPHLDCMGVCKQLHCKAVYVLSWG